MRKVCATCKNNKRHNNPFADEPVFLCKLDEPSGWLDIFDIQDYTCNNWEKREDADG